MKQFNVVIIGFGRAGKARLSSLHQLGQTHFTLVTKRPQEVDKFIKLKELEHLTVFVLQDWQKVLSESTAQTVFICSENHLHYEQVRYALEQKKHVCVEFPLCMSLNQAEELYALAHHKNSVLHVECIGTLTSRHQELKSLVQDQQIKRLEFDFTGSLYRWLIDEVKAKRFAELSFGRLYQCIDLFAGLQVLDVDLAQESDVKNPLAYVLKLELGVHYKDDAPIKIQIIEHRKLEAQRSSQVHAYSAHGLIPLAPMQRSSLFLLDSLHFFALVEHCDQESKLKSDDRYILDYALQDKVLTTYALIQKVNHLL